MADANLWQFVCAEFGGHLVGYAEQIGKAKHSRTLRARVKQQADLQVVGAVSFCRHCVDRANPQLGAHSL